MGTLRWVVWALLVGCGSTGTGLTGDGGVDQPDLVGWVDPGGTIHATLAATREVVRETAAGAPAGDSDTTISVTANFPVAAWRWELRDSTTGAVVVNGTAPTVSYTCPTGGRGAVDAFVEVTVGVRQASFLARRLVTCTLPRVAAGRQEFTVELDAAHSYMNEGKIQVKQPNGSYLAVAVPPGSLVHLKGSLNAVLGLLNFIGTEAQPIHFINDGEVKISSTGKSLYLVNNRHILIDGLGTDGIDHGFVIDSPTGNEAAVFMRNYNEGNGVTMGLTDLEIYGVNIKSNMGSGITLDSAGSVEFNRDNWHLDHLMLHHNLVENTGLEGFYIGHTRDWTGFNGGEPYPHYQLYGVKIYRNTVHDTGQDGIQVGNCVSKLEIHDNSIAAAGKTHGYGQWSGLQYNPGNAGAIYSNKILGGGGLNMQVGCTGGDTYVFGNIIEPALDGDGAYIIGGRANASYWFFDNTIRTTDGAHGIALNTGASPDCGAGTSAQMKALTIVNNIVVTSPNPNSNAQPPALYFRDGTTTVPVTIVQTPNVYRTTPNMGDLCFADAAHSDYRLACATSVALSGDGVSLSTVTSAAALPTQAFVDFEGRVAVDPKNYGGYQTSMP